MIYSLSEIQRFLGIGKPILRQNQTYGGLQFQLYVYDYAVETSYEELLQVKCVYGQ